MNTLKITRQILNKYNLRANKRFGQNFLIDDSILKDIVEVSEIEDNDLVIEIGPGLGNLSEYLINSCKYCVLIEIDKNMITVLEDRLKNYTNYVIVSEDVLKINIDDLICSIEEKNNTKYKNVKVVANLPYYITTPILFKLLEDSNRITEIIVMVQKEVAERMVANYKSKDYGILTLMTEYLSDANIKFIVPPSSFIPPPNVNSAVIKLVKNKKYEVSNENLLFDLIHKAFAERRKKLINSLSDKNFNNMTKDEIKKLILDLGYKENVRAEELKIEDFINIINSIK